MRKPSLVQSTVARQCSQCLLSASVEKQVKFGPVVYHGTAVPEGREKCEEREKR